MGVLCLKWRNINLGTNLEYQICLEKGLLNIKKMDQISNVIALKSKSYFKFSELFTLPYF